MTAKKIPPNWRNQEDVKKAVKTWLKSQKGVQLLPIGSWLNPLRIDILLRRPCPEELYLFELYEVKTRREDLKKAPYQLETCRIRLEDRGATRCYVVVPHWLIDVLDKVGEYPFFVAALKRFGYGVVTVSPALIPTVFWEPETFKRLKQPRWK